MAAYTALAFLSFLWGSSFLLIKIASRAFDPFGFRARPCRRRCGGDAADERASPARSGRDRRPGLWVKLLALALIGQVVPFLLLGKAATLTTSADMALMMGAQPIFVFLFGRFLGSREPLDLARGAWPRDRLRRRRRRFLVAGRGRPAPIRSLAAPSLWPLASSTARARSSRATRRGRSARSAP